jgi:hypothetical protein
MLDLMSQQHGCESGITLNRIPYVGIINGKKTKEACKWAYVKIAAI